LWPRLPQRHADPDRNLSRRLHRRLLHRLAPDREHLFPRWARTARLRFRGEARLSGGVRYALHLLAARPCHRTHLRPHLHLGRPAHRLRGARGMTALRAVPGGSGFLAPLLAPADAFTASAAAAPVRPKMLALSPLNRRRLRNFRANRRGWWSFWIFLV